MRKSIKIILFMAIIITITFANISHASTKIIRINFKDKDIYNEIVNQIKDYILNKDDQNFYIDMKKEEVEKIKEIHINANNGTTSELEGIENFEKLETLEVSGYKIENLSKISSLTNLKELKLNKCQISEIAEIEDLKKLESLDLSQNQIEDISILQNLTNLKKLNLNQNQIINIKPLENLTQLTGLDLSSNLIQDIKPLKKLSNLASTEKQYDIDMLPINLIKLINFEYLYLDNNQITDISPINKNIQNFTTIQGQKIIAKTKEKEIKLPTNFRQGKIELINCKLNEDKTKIIIDDLEKDTMVKITEGMFRDSVLRVQNDFNSPSLMIIYGNVSADNKSSTVTIKSDEEVEPLEGWEISDNKNKLTKTYYKNGTEKVKVYDLAGNKSEITISVKNINLPILNKEYKEINDITISKGNEIISEADKYVGKTPYILQGDSLTEGIDCSHFVYRILQICGLYSGRYIRSTNWIDVGEPVDGLENAIAGDVIVWDGHVAFYDGKGKLVEAKGKKWGLTHDRDAANAIKKSTYLGIRRFTGHQKVETVITEGQETENDVKVTINSSKIIKPIKGWNLSSDEKTLTKTYTKSINQTIKIKDYDGNEVETKIIINKT